MLAPIQKQFITYWSKLRPASRITMIGLVLSALILIPVLVSWATSPSFEVAYTGLSETDAAQIVQKMDDNNIAYQLKDNGTILVHSDKVYTSRLLMAREGLPASSTVGYELFSGTSTLGMTEFSQKVNYQRAIEGELQRTISSLDSVKAVRVHLVIPEKTLLSSVQTPSTASITLQIKPGKTMDPTQVRAITHLVASSVEGLKAENVVVVDSLGNMLADGSTSDSQTFMNQSDSQNAAELAYAKEVQNRVQTILDKTLGPNHSVVQATVEMDWTQREITSNKYEPTTVAIRSSQKINETSNSSGTTGGVPGAASNLPTPVATTTTGNGPTSYQRTEETLNYEVSQVQSHEISSPGKVNRISVSVMVDNITDQTQLDAIKKAAEVAAGIDTTRGDQIAVESYAFDRTALDALTTELATQQQQELYIQIAIAVGAGLVLVALLFLVLRMINNLRNASKESWKTILRPVGELAAMQAGAGAAALPGQPQHQQLPSGIPSTASAMSDSDSDANSSTPAPKKEEEDIVLQITSRNIHSNASEDEQRARVVARLAEESPATVAEIIQIWLNESKKG